MASTTFVDYITPITAEWLNDTNKQVYSYGAIARPVTSTTSASISVGIKVFTLADNFPSPVGGRVLIGAAGSNGYMVGTITAKDTTAKTCTVNITTVRGGGTYANWQVTPLTVGGFGYISTGGLTPVIAYPSGTSRNAIGFGTYPQTNWGATISGFEFPAAGAIGSDGAQLSFGMGYLINALGVDWYNNASTGTAYKVAANTTSFTGYYAGSGANGSPITWTQSFQFTSTGLNVTGTTKTSGYTVSTLPAGTQGMRAYVTDALLPVFLSVVVGGGAVVCPVFHNGTAWVVG